jgi:hypothetical protein
MKAFVLVVAVGLMATGLAAPFLGTFGTKTTLEKRFLRTAFCQEFKCQTQPKPDFYLVFKLANGIEIKLDHCCQHAGALFVKLEPKVTLSKEKIRTLKALIRTATGQKLEFDVQKNCSSIAAIKQSKKLEFYLKPSKRWGIVTCVEDTTGIPEGQENTAPEFVPSYHFEIVLPV